MCGLLARAAGHEGMAGGQAIDLASIGLPLNEMQLRDMHRRKTGALLQASVLMGAACGEMPAQGWQALSTYGAALGLAFQVVDDILDVTQASETLGKTAGKDEDLNKPTYVSVLGLEGARNTGADPARTCTGGARRQRLAAHCAPESGWPTWWSTATARHSLPNEDSPCSNRSNAPADLRRLSRSELPQLARELREFVLQSVSKTGGHLSSNLGTVELTIALHYVFDTPHDRIVWDVGHQTYPHKILTGRRERMHTLRQLGGIGGFPRRDESEYDTFGTAHSSTSISAALGMAHGRQAEGRRPHGGGGDRRRRAVAAAWPSRRSTTPAPTTAWATPTCW